MLSDVERDRKSPTIRVACLIAAGLGCTVSDLLQEAPVEDVSIVTHKQRQRLRDPRSGVERQLLSPLFSQRGIEIVWYELPPRASSGVFPPHSRGVYEHVTLFTGSIELRVGTTTHRLAKGDSVSYPAHLEHEVRALAHSRASYLLIIDSTDIQRR
jgi:quercetin dioxygenase-like cupin family protein